MIVGVVNATREATIRLAVRGANQQTHQIDATVDTGFTGSLTLPLALITTLELPWLGRAHGMLGDGSLHVFDVYATNVLWDGQDRLVETDAVDTVPLVGMGLLEGHELRLQAVAGGLVTIQVLPPHL